MGGRVGYGVARYAPARCRALVIGGAEPYTPDPEVFRRQAATLRSEGVASMVIAGEKQNGPMPAGMRARMLANDSEALAACSIGTGNAPSFEGVLASRKLRTLIYVGDRDQPRHDLAARGAAGIPWMTFISLPGLDHRANTGNSHPSSSRWHNISAPSIYWLSTLQRGARWGEEPADAPSKIL